MVLWQGRPDVVVRQQPVVDVRNVRHDCQRILELAPVDGDESSAHSFAIVFGSSLPVVIHLHHDMADLHSRVTVVLLHSVASPDHILWVLDREQSRNSSPCCKYRAHHLENRMLIPPWRPTNTFSV